MSSTLPPSHCQLRLAIRYIRYKGMVVGYKLTNQLAKSLPWLPIGHISVFQKGFVVIHWVFVYNILR